MQTPFEYEIDLGKKVTIDLDEVVAVLENMNPEFTDIYLSSGTRFTIKARYNNISLFIS